MAKCDLPYTKVGHAGGSTRGYAYIGVYEELFHLGVFEQLEYVYGTSAGAIVSLIIATGWPFDKIESLYKKIDAKKWTCALGSDDQSIEFELISPDSPSIWTQLINLFQNLGMHNGHAYTKFFRAIVKERTKCPNCHPTDNQAKTPCKVTKTIHGKTECYFKDGLKDCTFAEWNLYKNQFPEQGLKDLGMDLGEMNKQTGGRNTEFSSRSSAKDILNTPISIAVRGSMAMHNFFQPVVINGRIYCDGGVLKNFPISRLIEEEHSHITIKDKNGKTKKCFGDPNVLGIYLSSEAEIRLIETESGVYTEHDMDDIDKDGKIDSAWDLFSATFAASFSSQRQQHIDRPFYVANTIHVDTLGIDMLEMDLSTKQQEALRLSGKYAVARWLAMHHEVLAIKHYGEKLIANIKAQHFPPSVEKFMQSLTLSFDELEDGALEAVKGWSMIGEIMNCIRNPKMNQHIEYPEPPAPFRKELPFANKTYTPKLNQLQKNQRQLIIEFVQSLDRTGIYKPDKTFVDPVVLTLNGELYNRPTLQLQFVNWLQQKGVSYENLHPLLHNFSDFLQSIYTQSPSITSRALG